MLTLTELESRDTPDALVGVALSAARRLWADDTGSVIATEYTLLCGVVVFGTIPALVAARDAANAGLLRSAASLSAVAPDPEVVRRQVAQTHTPPVVQTAAVVAPPYRVEAPAP
jgi:hypothetical protein